MHYEYDEYLRLLAENDVKLEYQDGVIYAMAGGTIAHGALGAAMIHFLQRELLGRCRVFSSDVKVRIEATDLSTFPDASVVCGDVEASKIDAHAIVNPSLLVEVTSRSTEDYDRGDKLSHFKQIPSLRAALFVSHRERRVTIVSRTPQGWKEVDRRGGELVTLEEPSLAIAVDEVFAGVALDPS